MTFWLFTLWITKHYWWEKRKFHSWTLYSNCNNSAQYTFISYIELFLNFDWFLLCMINDQFTLWDAPAGNYGSCIHQNKHPVQDYEYNYHDSLQVHLIEGIWPLDDRHIADITDIVFVSILLLYKTSRLHIAVCLFSNWSQKMSECGKNIMKLSAIASCTTFFLFTTCWYHLWSFTGKTQ